MNLYNRYRPLVSVIIPTFNRRPLLARAVDSVLRQSFRDWELWIMDDGSEDDTFGLVKGYALANKRVHYIYHSNRGPSLSLNSGILASSAGILTFLGSDDELKEDHISSRYEYLLSHPEIDMLHGGLEIIGDSMVPDRNDLSKKISIDDCIVGGTFFGKKKVFLNGFDPRVSYGEDSDFFHRTENLFKFARVDFRTYIYHRETPGSITNSACKKTLGNKFEKDS